MTTPAFRTSSSRLRRLAAAGGAVAVLLVAAPAAAMAQPDGAESGDDFGRHVAECARDMKVDGEHNPGVHEGFASWHGQHCPH
ncbi:MAG TPA: hypothetical protein VFR23_15045 [Jiangellaceae bacterium]|nr:hypothetical protein [Jiangellaceae bacterium]